MNTSKEARRDAAEYARAQMFYGEGAGTRRKLITATVDAKVHRDPAYGRAFRAELERQDMAEHAAKARGERKRTDRSEAVHRNVRGALTGNSKSMNTGVLVVVAAAYVAHKTGLDKVAYEKSKSLIADVKARYRRKRHIREVYNVTNIRH